MNLDCLSGIFSFCCKKKKKKANNGDKDGSDTESVSDQTFVSKIDDSSLQEDNLDIIDSYSKSENSNKKIKKTIQLDKMTVRKSNGSFNNSKRVNSRNLDHIEESEFQSDESPSSNKVQTKKKIRITKDRKLRNESQIEELAESLKNLNTNNKIHKLSNLNERIKTKEKKRTSEEKPFGKKDVSKSSHDSSQQNTEEGDIFFSSSFSKSSFVERRNILTDSDMKKIQRRKDTRLDSDSEICFLKNQTENTKFNHNLKKKLLEYLIKKDTR